jgi:hypothetical protein
MVAVSLRVPLLRGRRRLSRANRVPDFLSAIEGRVACGDARTKERRVLADDEEKPCTPTFNFCRPKQLDQVDCYVSSLEGR